MKKLLAVAASAALCCFALAGCASGAPATSQSSSSAQASSAAESQSADADAVAKVTADDVVVIPAESTVSDYSRYVGKRVDVTGTITGVDASTFTVDRNSVTFTCTPLNTNSLQYIKAGSRIEIEGTITSATDGAVTLENVTIDDSADDYYDLDQYERDYDDLYNDDFDDDDLFDYDD